MTGEEGGGTLLVQRVEELADAHRAYAQLFEVCQLQGDDFKLHSIMMRQRVTDSGNHLDLEQSAVAYVFDRYACWILLLAFVALLSCVNNGENATFWLMISWVHAGQVLSVQSSLSCAFL